MLTRRVFRAVAWPALLLASGTQLLAQCPMCRTATAQDPVAAHALNMGILLLLLPALTLFSGVFLFAFHFRNPADKDESEESHRRP